jgi:hypothetical protein
MCFGPVEEVLASREGEPEKAILDLGYVASLADWKMGLLNFLQAAVLAIGDEILG